MLRAFQWDLARQVERLDWLLDQLPRYADWGYQELYLHLEDAVEYPSLPGVARADAYSYRDFERLVTAAGRSGLKVVPIVNLLGHTQYLIKTPALRDLNELRAPDGTPLERGQICPVHPRTLEIADRLLRDMAPFCTAGKVHVGLDESFHLGRHPLSRAEIAEIGLAAHFGRYVQRLHGLVGGLGLRLGLWADMLALLPDAIPLLPPGAIAYDWYYYPFARHPRVELHNFAECDLATPLRAQGVEYWGCPMNGAFRSEPLPVFGDRLANLRSWWTRCQRVGAAGFLVTSWEASRLALEMTTVIDAAAACLWLEPETDHQSDMLARGFARVFAKVGRVVPTAPRRRGGTPPYPSAAKTSLVTSAATMTPEVATKSWARAALAGDEHAFAGYARWEINDRWDVGAARNGLAAYEREERFFARLSRIHPLSLAQTPPPAGERLTPIKCQTLEAAEGIRAGFHAVGAGAGGPGLPPPFAASVAFRHYLAERDVFVRKAARGVWRLRRLLAKAVATSVSEWTPKQTPLAHSTSSGPRVPRQARDLELVETACRGAHARGYIAQLRQEAVGFAAALRAGRKAAQVMWARTRDPQQRGPNEQMLVADAARLGAWRRWLAHTARRPALAWEATPVCGAWQLQFTVHNFAPALQRVVVEQQRADGVWEELYGRYTIEFRAFAARPRTRIKREFSVPVGPDLVSGPAAVVHDRRIAEEDRRLQTAAPEPAAAGRARSASRTPLARSTSSGPRVPRQARDLELVETACRGAHARGYGPSLRLAVRGLGQVAISHVELTNGVRTLRPAGWRLTQKKILGRPAPRQGFPEFDLERNQGEVTLRFSD
jgi:hypothetical protein